MKTLTITFLFASITLNVFSQETTVNLCCNKGLSHDLYSILKDWQALLAVIIVIIGWFVNSQLNKKHEITKRRIDNRLEALKSIFESVIFEMSKGTDKAFAQKDFKDKLERSRAIIQVYGYRKEIVVYEEFIAALNLEANTDEEKKNKLDKINDCIPKLSIIIESLRTELGLETYKKKKINK
jgi:hypothetical protein